MGYQKADELLIAAQGAGLRWDIAQGLFPRLDIRKYKDYPEQAEQPKKYEVHLIRFFKQCELDQSLGSVVVPFDQLANEIQRFLNDPYFDAEHTNIQIWENKK